MSEKYEIYSFDCDYETAPLVEKALQGLDAKEIGVDYGQYIHYHMLITLKDREEFEKRLLSPDTADQRE